MSFRSLRQRLKPDRLDDREHGRHAYVSSEEFEVVQAVPSLSSMMDRDESDRMSFHSAASQSPMDPSSPESRFKDADERAVFEQQLTLLQEQLVAVMIENQSLQRQVEEMEEKIDKDKTLALLDYERHRAQLLEDKLTAIEKKKQKRIRKPQRSKSDVILRPQLQRRLSAGDMMDVEPASEAEEDSFSDASFETQPVQRLSLFDRMWERILRIVYGVMDDFTDMPQQEPEGDAEGDPLTVKKLKENIKRAGAGAKPYVNTVQGIYSLLTWKSPPYTLIVFMVYMYSVWCGWFLPLLLACLTFRLAINYLKFRGWNVNFNFFDCHEEEKKKDVEDKDMGVSDRFTLVLHVARKVQNALGSAADGLEKIKSLLTWRHPTATKQLFFLLLIGSVTSCLFSASTLFFMAGLYLGLKMFILDYLFMRFPRLKMKYDSSYKLWQELPTDAEYEKRSMQSEIDRYILPKSRHDSGEMEETEEVASEENLSVDDKQFCELFSLPLSESPLPGWHGGRRCTLINREKSLTAAFKNGRLYLTHSFLCFERTKVPSPKNIVVPLTDIVRLEKAKPYAWMPGGGMAIEVAVAGSDKPLMFAALINRDEVYESILDFAEAMDLPFVRGRVRNAEETSATQRFLNSLKLNRTGQARFQHFSLASNYEDSD